SGSVPLVYRQRPGRDVLARYRQELPACGDIARGAPSDRRSDRRNRAAAGEFVDNADRPGQRARKLLAGPSPGYRTFLGEQTHYEQSLAGGRIRLENRLVDGVPSLVMSRVPTV